MSPVFQAFWVHNIWAPHSGHGDDRTRLLSIITPLPSAGAYNRGDPVTALHERVQAAP